jgi:acetylornithine deacetylase/succinyl-diaminopimelate desuccinylase-like protein
MRSLDVDTDVVETGGFPLVVGTAGRGDRTLLLYGHYDVQPTGPVEAWRDPPFSATIRDGCIWGRGVGDNKGQLLAHLCALDAWRRITGGPPAIKTLFVFDGEEEIGSPVTLPFIAANPERFRADLAFGADGSTLGVPAPAMYLAVHGLLYLELTARGSAEEWHSGSYGSLLPNPVHRLARAVASLVDASGLVAIDGFYDKVRAPSLELRRLLDELPPEFLRDPGRFGVQEFSTSTPREAMFFAPKLCLCGFAGGYTGDGVKTAVPTGATAKIDVTLAPDQDPEEILTLVRAHLDRHGFGDVDMRALATCPPVAIDPDHELVRVVGSALQEVWQRRPVVFPSIGGGGPLAAIQSAVGAPALMVPYAQHDLHEHSTEEHLSLEWFVNGIKTTAELYRRLAAGAA